MFTVEGRSFENSLYAFTFAQIQADRMDRPVEVLLAGVTFHARAHPPHYRPVRKKQITVPLEH